MMRSFLGLELVFGPLAHVCVRGWEGGGRYERKKHARPITHHKSSNFLSCWRGYSLAYAYTLFLSLCYKLTLSPSRSLSLSLSPTSFHIPVPGATD